ncbi:MAG: sigma-70 family RNA polymerase sigma factor [Candidatus Eisenbacteria bacterium]
MTGESTQPALGFWEAAFQEHGGSLLRFLSSRVRRREDAEDLLQEIFVRAMRARTDRSEPDNPWAYLFHHGTTRAPEPCPGGGPARCRPRSGRGGGGVGGAEGDLRSRDPGASAPTGACDRTDDASRTIAFEHALLEHKPYEQIARERGGAASR